MFKRINETLNRLEWRWSLWQLFTGTSLVASFSLPAWATWATGLFSEYAPLSWVVAGLGGVLLIAIAFGLFGYARRNLSLAAFQDRVSRTSSINPLDRTFERQRIKIAEMSPPIGGIIDGKTFVDCDLVGPANIVVMNCTFSRNSGEAVDAALIRKGGIPRNGFGFRGCTFNECRFYLITFLVPDELQDEFQRYGWNNLNWITDDPAQGSLLSPPTIQTPTPTSTPLSSE